MNSGALDLAGTSVIDAQVEVAKVARMLARARLVTAFGHVSVRLPGGAMAISSTRPLILARPEDTVIVSADGELLAGAVDDAPLERWLHASIYRARADVRGICRGHSDAVVAWGTSLSDLPLLHGLGLLVGRRVPVHSERRLISNVQLAEAAAASLADNSAVLLHTNGGLAVGSTALQAAARLWALEDRARVALAAPASPEVTSPEPVDIWAEREAATSIELARTERWFETLFTEAPSTADYRVKELHA